MQRCAGALERVRVSCARHACSAARVRLSGCAYYVPERCAGAPKRVCVSCARHVCSAVRARLSGCACHVPSMCAVLRGCT